MAAGSSRSRWAEAPRWPERRQARRSESVAPTGQAPMAADATPYAASFYESHAEASLRSARCALAQAFGLLGIPGSVVDLGCGTGAWLRAAQELGAGAILGVDGDWVPREQLLIPADRFLAADFAAPDT